MYSVIQLYEIGFLGWLCGLICRIQMTYSWQEIKTIIDCYFHLFKFEKYLKDLYGWMASLAICIQHTNPLNLSKFQTTIKYHAYASVVSKFPTLLISPCSFHFWQPFYTTTHFCVGVWPYSSMLQNLVTCMNNIRKLTGYRAGRKKRCVQIIAL